jgi:PhnB protein
MSSPSSKPEVNEHGAPVGWPQLTPYMTVRDAEASIEFYRSAFGFELVGEVMKDQSGRVQHAGMRLGDAAIMFAPENEASPMRAPAASGAVDSLSLYIYVPEVDALARRAADAGAEVLEEPADQFWGDRIAVFKCPNGYHWTFATHVADFDPTKAP